MKPCIRKRDETETVATDRQKTVGHLPQRRPATVLFQQTTSHVPPSVRRIRCPATNRPLLTKVRHSITAGQHQVHRTPAPLQLRTSQYNLFVAGHHLMKTFVCDSMRPAIIFRFVPHLPVSGQTLAELPPFVPQCRQQRIAAKTVRAGNGIGSGQHPTRERYEKCIRPDPATGGFTVHRQIRKHRIRPQEIEIKRVATRNLQHIPRRSICLRNSLTALPVGHRPEYQTRHADHCRRQDPSRLLSIPFPHSYLLQKRPSLSGSDTLTKIKTKIQKAFKMC